MIRGFQVGAGGEGGTKGIFNPELTPAIHQIHQQQDDE